MGNNNSYDLKKSYPFSDESITLIQKRIIDLMDSEHFIEEGSVDLCDGYVSFSYSLKGERTKLK